MCESKTTNGGFVLGGEIHHDTMTDPLMFEEKEECTGTCKRSCEGCKADKPAFAERQAD